MKTTTADHPGLWARILVIAGGIAMLLGAVDPLEGAILILPGSGLVALGTFLGHANRRSVAYRVVVFLLIAFGVGAMWRLSALGGFGGPSGLSMWWGVLVLPYLIGWSMGIWGPGSPRWVLALGILVGLWYLRLCGMLLSHPSTTSSAAIVIVLGSLGLMTIVGCIIRLAVAFRHSQTPTPPSTSSP